jgi:hypothetical protein
MGEGHQGSWDQGRLTTAAMVSARPLNELTATEIIAAVRAGRATCEDVTRACLDRIAEREKDVQAWQYINPEQAIAEARARDRSDRPGALIGVPFSVKDLCRSSAASRCVVRRAQPQGGRRPAGQVGHH